MTADNVLKNYFLQAKKITEIRDTGGAVLGYYIPAAAAAQVPALRLVALFDPEELRRRKDSSHSGHTFDQVSEHLRSLEMAM